MNLYGSIRQFGNLVSTDNGIVSAGALLATAPGSAGFAALAVFNTGNLENSLITVEDNNDGQVFKLTYQSGTGVLYLTTHLNLLGPAGGSGPNNYVASFGSSGQVPDAVRIQADGGLAIIGNSFYTTFIGSVAQGANVVYTLPAAQGAADTVLTNDGSGLLSWNSVASYTPSTEQDIGTLTWSSGIDPSGTITKRYQWSRVGNLVTVQWRIEASIAGTAVTANSFALPGDMPLPVNFTNQSNDEWVTVSSGAVLSTGSSTLTNGASAGLYKNSGTYEIRTYSGTVSVAASFVAGSLTYLAV